MAKVNIDAIDADIAMIDFEFSGIKRAGALYLIKSATKTCLIDSGTRESSRRIINALDAIQAFPPDIVILTHSHWDHTQGTPAFCREALKRGKQITVMASEKAIPNLKDQSWNGAFDAKHKYENILDVEPLKEGQVVNLGDHEIEIFDFCGHSADDIAIYDRNTKTIFIGDALGCKFEHYLFFPPFMPPFWNKDRFYRTAEKLKQIDYERVCLAHYGCLDGKEAADFPDEAIAAMETWWNVFVASDQKGKLDDLEYMATTIVKEAHIVMPELELTKPHMKIFLSLVNAGRRLVGKNPIDVAAVQLESMIKWLTTGYRGATH